MTLVAQQEQPWSGVSLEGELQALVAGCGVYKLDHTLLSLTGRDRVRWLNGMVSNNIRDLAAGHGVYAFVLNAQGHIQADLYAYNRGESILVETERAQAEKLLQIFRRYIIMDKVEIEDLTEKWAVISIAGPKADQVLGTLGLSSGDLAILQFAETRWNDAEIILVRGDNPCLPNYELWVSKEHWESLWSAVLNAGAQEIRDEALEGFRILCGIAKLGRDIRERDLPQETGQERALSFTKGCYIGQEIVERIRSRGAVHRALMGFEFEGSAPPAGTKIQTEGKDVGEITSVAQVPSNSGERVVALGYLRKEFSAPGKELVAGEAKVKPVALPFLRRPIEN